MKSYRVPAPWGGIRFLEKDGLLWGIVPELEPAAAPDDAPQAIGRWMALALELLEEPRLLDDDERRYQDMMVALYENVGYECRAISAETGLGVAELEGVLAGKVSVLSGNSGVGKSTLINRILPGANLRTAEISDAHDQGTHTTTFSEMLRLPSGGYLIDTPGIKGFGTFDIEPGELSGYFKDIFSFAKDCRFSNCTHTHEPGCAVIRAVEERYIAQSRYQSYLSMLEDKDESKYREAF